MQFSEQYIEFFLDGFWHTTQGIEVADLSFSCFFEELLLSLELREAFFILRAAAIGRLKAGSFNREVRDIEETFTVIF